MATREEKAGLRREVARLIEALPEDERREKSQAACERLAQAPEVRDARTILLYAPMPDELDVWPALHAFRVDRLVYGARNPRMGAVASRREASSPPCFRSHAV